LLREGTILAKWNMRDAPLPDELSENLLSLVIENQQIKTELHKTLLFVLILALAYTGFIYFIKSALKNIVAFSRNRIANV